MSSPGERRLVSRSARQRVLGWIPRRHGWEKVMWTREMPADSAAAEFQTAATGPLDENMTLTRALWDEWMDERMKLSINARPM